MGQTGDSRADKAGVVRGFADGTFDPENGVTRAETSVRLHRVYLKSAIGAVLSKVLPLSVTLYTPTSMGSGTITRWGIVTNYHVIERYDKLGPGDDITAVYYETHPAGTGASAKVKVLAHDEAQDLALLTDPVSQPFPRLGFGADDIDRSPFLGQDILVVGAPLGISFNLTKGIISHLGVWDGRRSYLGATPPSTPATPVGWR